MDADRLSRREFVARSAAMGLALGARGTWGAGQQAPVVAVFSKHLQWLPFADVGPVIAESGFRAADLTVRPGGHVLPERVEDDLPRAVETLRRSGISVPMITTAITDARDPLTRRVLATAKKLGVSNYRMGYWNFPPSPGPMETLRALRPRVQELAALNRELGIRGGYQNHSGTRVGGSVWDLAILLEGVDPSGLGVQYDIRHATVEGGHSWPTGLRVIAPHIDTIAVKDFHWQRLANGRWDIRNVPLGDGMVDYRAFLPQLLALRALPPVTMHFEYEPLEMNGGGGAARRRETVAGMRRDLSRFETLLAGATVRAPSVSKP
jgi:sugar phosphate isomerase/epimerase